MVQISLQNSGGKVVFYAWVPRTLEHEPNFSKFYPLTISFLVSQFCTLESSLCVSSSDYYLISPFGSSLIKVVLDPNIRTTECTHQTTSVHRMNS